MWLFLHLNSTENVEPDPGSTDSRRNLKELIFRHGKSGGGKFSRNASTVIKGKNLIKLIIKMQFETTKSYWF